MAIDTVAVDKSGANMIALRGINAEWETRIKIRQVKGSLTAMAAAWYCTTQAVVFMRLLVILFNARLRLVGQRRTLPKSVLRDLFY